MGKEWPNTHAHACKDVHTKNKIKKILGEKKKGETMEARGGRKESNEKGNKGEKKWKGGKRREKKKGKKKGKERGG